jgi:hypothetical protein
VFPYLKAVERKSKSRPCPTNWRQRLSQIYSRQELFVAANLCRLWPVNEARQPSGKLIYFGAGQSTKGKNARPAGCILKRELASFAVFYLGCCCWKKARITLCVRAAFLHG